MISYVKDLGAFEMDDTHILQWVSNGELFTADEIIAGHVLVLMAWA